VKESEESVDLMVVGSIMESAKIFEKAGRKRTQW